MAKSKKARQRKRSGVRVDDQHLLIGISLVLVVLAVGLYLNTLAHGFVFDDATLIEQNPELLNLDLWALGGPQGYRPVRSLTYALNYWLGGLNPYGYHLFNIILHSLNGVVLLWFLYALTSRIWLAVPASLLFVAHPVQTASVAYISGRKDLLATFFLLIGLLLYLRFRNHSRNLWLSLSLGSFILACLSKEVALVFPILVLIVEVVLTRRLKRRQSLGLFLRSRLLVLSLLGSSAGLLLVYSIYWASASRMEGFWGGSVVTNYGTSLKLFVHYLQLIVFPYPLLADYTGQVIAVSHGFLEPATLLAGAVFLAYGAFVVWAWRKNLVLGFGLSWFAAAVLPVLQIIPFHELAADHFLYLPAIGFSVAVGLGLERMLLAKDYQVLAAAILLLLVGIYGWRTLERNPDWKSPEALWAATYRDAPRSFRANCNLGMFAYNAGNYGRAVELTERCRELGPNESLPHANLGAVKRQMGHQALRAGDLEPSEKFETEALAHLHRALELDPKNIWSKSNAADAYKDLALIYEYRDNAKTARTLRVQSFRYFSEVLAQGSSHPRFPEIYYKAGAVLVDGGHYQQAIPYLQKAAKEMPEHGQLQYILGFSYYMLSQLENARKYLEVALAVQPIPDISIYLADTYRRLGLGNEALQTLEAGNSRFPNSVQIHYNLGILHEAGGRHVLAKKYFTRALDLEPAGPLAQDLKRLLGVD